MKIVLNHYYGLSCYTRVVKSSWLPAKIAAYLVSNCRLIYLAFLYGWHLKLKTNK